MAAVGARDALADALPRAQRARTIPLFLVVASVGLLGFTVLDAFGNSKVSTRAALIDLSTGLVMGALALAARRWRSDRTRRALLAAAVLLLLANVAAYSRLYASVGETMPVGAFAVAGVLIGIMVGLTVPGALLAAVAGVAVIMLDPSYGGGAADQLAVAALALGVAIVLGLRVRSDRATERAVADARLAHERELAAQASASRALAREERLASVASLAEGIAHEFNSPLMYARGRVEIAQAAIVEAARAPGLPDAAARPIDAARGDLDAAVRGLDRIATVAGALHDATRPPSAAPVEDVDVDAIARAALAQVAASLPDGVGARVRPGKPPAARAGREDVAVILLALVRNAADALAGAGRGGEIVVETGREGREVVVRVMDDGPGVPPELRSRLFTPLFTTKFGTASLGLSLSAARACARQVGGDLTFEPREGGGAVFRLALPVAEPAAAAVS